VPSQCEETRSAGTTASRRILVVGDGEDVRQFVEVVLESPGYTADCATDGRDALRRIKTEPPDLVLLDLMIPELDGWQVLRRLHHGPRTPVVAILSPFVESSRAIEAGAAGYITRPFGVDQLIGTCKRVLSATSATAWSAE
jgi:DNA-binding response OmpR family regulator